MFEYIQRKIFVLKMRIDAAIQRLLNSLDK